MDILVLGLDKLRLNVMWLFYLVFGLNIDELLNFSFNGVFDIVLIIMKYYIFSKVIVWWIGIYW